MSESNEISRENIPTQPTPQQSGEATTPVDIALYEAVWNGPLPPPKVLRGYEEIVPGAGNRIIEMAEKEQDHSHDMDKASSRRADRGLLAAFIISILIIGGGIYFIYSGYQWAGGSIIGINLTVLAAIFVYGSKNRNHEHDPGGADFR